MLDHLLSGMYANAAYEERVKTAAAMLKPVSTKTLEKVARLGFGKYCGNDTDIDWLERFQGTPLFPQAVALAKEELQASTQDDQAEQMRMQQHAQSDQLYMKKKLLEIQLVEHQEGQAQMDQQSVMGAAKPAAPPGAAPTPPAAGTGTSDVPSGPPAGDSDNKTASELFKQALNLGGMLQGGMNMVRKSPRMQEALVGGGMGAAQAALSGGGMKDIAMGGAMGAGSSALLHRPSAPAAPGAAPALAPKLAAADVWGRELARADYEKQAALRALQEMGQSVGQTLTKSAAFSVAELLENPMLREHAGALIGGGVGLAHGTIAGLFDKDEQGNSQGVGHAAMRGLGEGLTGAAIGHGVHGLVHSGQNIHNRMNQGSGVAQSFGGALSGEAERRAAQMREAIQRVRTGAGETLESMGKHVSGNTEPVTNAPPGAG